MSTQLVKTNLGIRLRDILPDAKLIGSSEVYFRSCCGLWNDCQTGDLFVAIMDAEQDGHDFIHEAIQRGATAIVTERLLSTNQPQCLVDDSREAYGKICQALAGQPSQRLTTIGVSGTDGKTVTSHLIASVFEAAGQKTGLVSSIEVNCGTDQQSVPNHQLNPPWLAEQLSNMVIQKCASAVIEIPSVALAKRGLSGVDLDIAVLTNIRQDHLNFHGSPANYRRAKMRVLNQLKPTGLAVLNIDDPTTHFLLEKIDKPVLTIGIKQEADVTATVIERSASEQTFMVTAGSDSIPVRTTIIGDQHVYNCLTAMAVGLASGFDLATIAQGLETVGQIPGRLERIECGQSFGVWIDSARSTGQLSNAIRALKQVTKGNVWCVCSIDDGQTPLHRQRMGEVVERASDHAVITRTAVDEAIDYEPAHQVLDGFDDPSKAQFIPNRFKAIEWTLQQAQPGDAVLVTGCGERPFALVGEHKWTINDRDVCQAWLYDNAMPSGDETSSVDAPEIFNINDYRDL
ncbi:MAG: UDP-N-acetylmuramoyl-L-alanyl-D-glutamate--2,6-diaminopimelate ligase [Mariniblastus sp.]